MLETRHGALMPIDNKKQTLNQLGVFEAPLDTGRVRLILWDWKEPGGDHRGGGLSRRQRLWPDLERAPLNFLPPHHSLERSRKGVGAFRRPGSPRFVLRGSAPHFLPAGPQVTCVII